MRLRIPLMTLFLALAAVACTRPGSESAAMPLPTADSEYTAGSVNVFYGEVYKDGRFYLFGTKAAYTGFVTNGDIDPKIMVTKIGAGPGNKTVIHQIDKDSKVMENRLLDTLKGRYVP